LFLSQTKTFNSQQNHDTITIRYDTKEAFSVDSKADWSA